MVTHVTHSARSALAHIKSASEEYKLFAMFASVSSLVVVVIVKRLLHQVDGQVTLRSSLMCCSSTQRRRVFAGRHVFVLASSSGLRGHKRTYRTILESADHPLFKMVRSSCDL
jgi:hypothetical protein